MVRDDEDVTLSAEANRDGDESAGSALGGRRPGVRRRPYYLRPLRVGASAGGVGARLTTFHVGVLSGWWGARLLEGRPRACGGRKYVLDSAITE